MEHFPSGTVTFLFTDIEGSTKLARLFPDGWPTIEARHNVLLQSAITANHGYVFRTIGDEFNVAFASALDALEAALAAQTTLHTENWGAIGAIRVRMSLHTGQAKARANDYDGYLTLSHTKRLLATAYGGQILLSQATEVLLRDSLPPGVTLLDLGEHRLKDFERAEHIFQLVAPDLPAEFPPLKTLNALPNNLPVQITSFIGRERELAQTNEMLSNTHLLTLIGPGGTGKTRLTLQLAAEVLPGFTDGVWLVELAPLADPALVLQTIASTLGLREIPSTPLNDLVADYLHSKCLLLILDNCEHLVETCAQLADAFLRHCPSLKMIASSREALGIAGETVFRVPPLALPDQDSTDLDTLRQSEAVQLFVERAVAVRPGFDLSGQNAPAVGQICLRLDGVPLALELAAARIGMLTSEQIAARLDDRFRLLTGGSRTALPRQQTLRSLIDWSYDLLSEAERSLFCQLSVFVGGWSLEAAEAVCTDLDVLELLTQLVKKSLVVAEERAEQAETRFRLLETIRQYARDKLLETGAVAMVRDRHLDYYQKFAEAGEPNFFGPHRLEWVDQCEREHDNFRAALQWGLDRNSDGALRLAGSLVTFWTARGFNLEGRRWLQASLDRAAALPEAHGEADRQRQAARAKGLTQSSQLSYADGNYQVGLNAGQESVRLYRQLGDPFGLGFALCNMGNMAAFQGDMAMAEPALTEAIFIGRETGNKIILCYALGVLSRHILLPRGDIAAAHASAEESVRFSQEAGVPWSEALAELILARIAAMTEQWEEARRRALKAVDVYRELRDPLALNQAYNDLGDIELRAGNLPEAQRLHRQCILASQEFGARAFVAHELESFAFIAQADNQPARAACLLGAAEAMQEGIGTSAFGVERLENEYKRTVDWLHAQLDETTYDACWSEGCAMTMDQAISYALQE